MSEPTKELRCPKCQGTMRSYERNGVIVDQCETCRGIFLDRGELDRLVDAERAWNQAASAPAPTPQMPPMRDDGDYRGRIPVTVEYQ